LSPVEAAMVRHAAPIRNRAASDLNDISDFRRMTKHLGLIEAPLQKRRGLRRHACEPFPIRLRPRENRHDSGGGDRPARQGSGRSCRNDRRLTAVAHRPGSVAESPRLRAQVTVTPRSPIPAPRATASGLWCWLGTLSRLSQPNAGPSWALLRSCR